MERAGLLLAVCACAYVAAVLGQVATLCRPNERFLTCGGCQKTCDDPAPACAAVCRTGCYCEPDQVRNSTGHCVALSECPSNSAAAYKLATSEPRTECPPNEEYRFCSACAPSCAQPAPACPAQCARGCFCRGQLLRHDNGSCVEAADCSRPGRNEKVPDGNESETNLILPYLNKRKACGPSMVFKDCEPCEKNCDNPNPICPAQCNRGCFCEDGLVKAPSGKCVKLEDCSKDGRDPIPYRVMCGPLQTFKKCGCERTCSNPNATCNGQCNRGCFCDDGLVKSPSGDCVKLDQCPKAEVTFGAADPSIEDCAPDEEFLSCGWCEPSCLEPAPMCAGVCARGCLCRPPLVRHYSGHCVELSQCQPQKCSNPNEEFVCRYGCEARCGRRTCAVRPRRCQLGCHCRMGLLRDVATGRCVTPQECPTSILKVLGSAGPTAEDRFHQTADSFATFRIQRNLQTSSIPAPVAEEYQS